MAFNPFESFRKNSKAIFAVVMIVCMFTFVLSAGISGGTDFFDWFARQFGGSDRGPVLAVIDGHDEYGRDLSEVRKKRTAANNFLARVVARSDAQLRKSVLDDISNKVVKDPIIAQKLQENLRFETQLPGNILALLEYFSEYQKNVELLNRTLRSMTDTNSAEYRTLYRYQTWLEHAIMNDRRKEYRVDVFFLSNPRNTNETDALEFLMLLREADKMGIKYSDDDVVSLIDAETVIPLAKEDADRYKAELQQAYGFSSGTINSAVADEFRVKTVKSILDGSVYGGKPSLPMGMTPYEFFEFYKDNCQELKFEVIDVPVDAFVSKVKEEPSDVDLRKFFDEYRRDEFDPSRSTPGFKEPRKMKIEFIGVDKKMPIYKKIEPPLQYASSVAAGLMASQSGNWLAGATITASPALAESWLARSNAQSRIEYLQSTSIFNDVMFPDTPFAKVKPVDSSLYHPLPNAAIAVQLATIKNPLTDVTAALAGYHNLAGLIETRDRVRVGMQLAIAPMGFNPLFPLSTFAPVAANAPSLPKGVYYVEELDRLRREDQPQHLARADLEALMKKLEEIRKKAQPKTSTDLSPKKKDHPKLDPKVIAEANAEARKTVDEWIKAHPGVYTGKSEKLDDKYACPDDPGLKVLAQEVIFQPLPYKSFEQAFFREQRGRDLNKELAEAGLFEPVPFPESEFSQRRLPGSFAFSTPQYVAWRIEDVPSKAYGRFDQVSPEMRAKIVRAWKFRKARDLAKAAAEKLAVEIRAIAKKELHDANNPSGFTHGLEDLVKTSTFSPLAMPVRLARLSLQASSQMPRRGEPMRYGPTPIENKQIPYPLPSMAEQLLDVRNKDRGEVVVLPDAPVANYYVSVMVEKDVPSVERFSQVFSKSNSPSGTVLPPDPLYLQFAREVAKRSFFDDELARLKAEMKYKETKDLEKSREKRSEGEPPQD